MRSINEQRQFRIEEGPSTGPIVQGWRPPAAPVGHRPNRSVRWVASRAARPEDACRAAAMPSRSSPDGAAQAADAGSDAVFLHWRRDLGLVLVVVAATYALSAYFNLAETLRRLTRPYEFLQLDELPVVMLAAALGLAWFAWRRYREARRELGQRRIAESTLARTLEENRRLARRFMAVQEEERRSLARELHDELGQYLNAIKLDAVAIASHAREPSSGRRAQSIVDSVDHVHGVVQALIRRFRPVALDELGLQAALEHCLDHWRRRLPGTVLRLVIRGDLARCGEPANLAIYRVVQEALTNVSRHARATRVGVRLERCRAADPDADEVRLQVDDNGVGTDLHVRRSGLGLVGMRERAEALGGGLHVDSAPGHGFSLRMTLPLAGGGRPA